MYAKNETKQLYARKNELSEELEAIEREISRIKNQAVDVAIGDVVTCRDSFGHVNTYLVVSKPVDEGCDILLIDLDLCTVTDYLFHDMAEFHDYMNTSGRTVWRRMDRNQ